MADLKKLNHKRGQISSELTRFVKFLNAFNSDTTSILLLETRLETILSGSLKDFNAIQAEIEDEELNQGTYDADASEAKRNDFEVKYHNAIAQARDIIIKAKVVNNPQVNLPPPNPNISNNNTKLPPLKLIEFTGLFSEWRKFYDTFNALVHSQTSISDIEKFYYLQGALKDDAAKVIESLPVTRANYTTAWNLLIDRFDNNRKIINAHIREIMEITCITKESYSELRNLIDNFLKHYRSLALIENNVIYWDRILIYILVQKIDIKTRHEWKNFSNKIDSPNIKEFCDFINDRCSILEEEPLLQKTNIVTKSKVNTENRSCHLYTQNLKKCIICKDNHPIYFCTKFKDMSIENRIEKIKASSLCINCLKDGHKSSLCTSNGCRICHKRHNTLLHRNIVNSSQNIQTNYRTNSNEMTTSNNLIHENQPENEISNTVLAHHTVSMPESMVLLSTAIVEALNSQKNYIKCRVLLDSGSQANFVTSSFADKLGINRSITKVPVKGINNVNVDITEKVAINISSLTNNYKVTLEFLVINKISNFTPQISFESFKIPIPHNISLADPQFYSAQPVDMLIGAGIFYDLLAIGQIKLGNNMPILQKTLLGWVVSGKMKFNQVLSAQSFLTNIELSKQIEKFWITEDVISNSSPNIKALTNEESNCEKIFENTTKRNEQGRFIVDLPLKENYNNLGESKSLALRRFYATERRLNSNSELRKYYTEFLTEYSQLDHMTEIKTSEQVSKTKFYLPHHAVIKPDKETTKVRVVFDGSAKTSSGISLNDILMVGPTIQEDLFSILIRFRQHNVVLIGDIAKMYRQILINPDQQELQCIIWRNSPSEQIKEFKLKTVTYGTASASFLATRCLKQIGCDSSKEYPIESKIIQTDFYVDDLITGASCIEDLIKIKINVTQLLSNYGFELRKFKSNKPQILNSNHESQILEYEITDDTTCKTLGIVWSQCEDCFIFKVQTDNIPSEVTKRTILSFIAKIYDPLGLLGPIVIRLKMLIQTLWQLKLNWDESLPVDLYSQWCKFKNQMNTLNAFKIPRHILLLNYNKIQIYGFADASEKAYACCLYVRSINNNNVKSQLLCSKTRVSPLKLITIPRLELMAALLLSRLLEKCLSAFSLNISEIYLYTDSQIVLAWLSQESRTWKLFVSNRVSEIQNLTKNYSWHHIASHENPADILSRGILSTELQTNELYWHGPTFLLSKKFDKPINAESDKVTINVNELPEYKKQVTTLLTQESYHFDLFDKFSNLRKLIRVTAYCFRFASNCKRTSNQRNIKFITNEEYAHAISALLKICQSESFTKEIIELNKNGNVKNNSNIKCLSPFLDANGFIRVGGRLRNSSLNFEQKHPILLPRHHKLTKLLAQFEHEQSLHAGTQGTLSKIRQKFWPINGKSLVQGIIKKCLRCFKNNPPQYHCEMGDLPFNRVNFSKPFISCGVDFAGPFDLKDGKLRNNKIIKCYISIFVCMSVKAIHIELVTDLSSAGFYSVLRRFVSRRGLCKDIFSDNATNFVGLNNELKSLQQIVNSEYFQGHLNESQITWHFIPARSPHFGGLWEAGVKSVKLHLRRILLNQTLTYEELNTILIEIEATLNSRPLIPLSSDPNDLNALTPAHFLIGTNLIAAPQMELDQKKINLVKRHQLVQQLFQSLCKKWTNDYLHQLQQKDKWKFDKCPKIIVGAMVILREDNVPPSKWILGRIEAVHPGIDGKIRVVTVKTASGSFKRSIVRICLLPNDES